MDRRRGPRMGLVATAMFMFSFSSVSFVIGFKDCESLGFTGLALCSDCKTLSEYVKDEELVSDCQRCCTEDSEDSMSKVIYSGAILEVCMRRLMFYPEVASFIEEEKNQFPSIKLRDVYASEPKLVMLGDNGSPKESIRIDNWKREHIRQFLQQRVIPNISAR